MHALTLEFTPQNRWEWIKSKLREKGTSLAELADSLGVSRSSIDTVRHRSYPKMEQAIARELNMEAKSLWPERYDERAMKRKRGKSKCNESTHDGTSNG